MAWSEELLGEYRRATTLVAGVDLSDWTTLRITGADRTSFLHNMCTNDIRALRTETIDGLPAGQQCEAFVTDVKGKIVAHVIVFALPDQLLLLTVPGQAEALIRHLERYIIREDVQLADATSELAWSLDIGPGTANRLGGEWSVVRGGRDLIWVSARCPQIWPGGCWMGPMRDKPRENTAPGQAVDERVWQALRIESGWPLFGVDFDGSNLPQEVGRDALAISFHKGCYLGQETIARIDALGHVNKRLTTVRAAGELAAGDELLANGESVGRVSSASYSPGLEAWLALAMVRRGHNEPGAQLTYRDQSAEVVPTPAVVAK